MENDFKNQINNLKEWWVILMGWIPLICLVITYVYIEYHTWNQTGFWSREPSLCIRHLLALFASLIALLVFGGISYGLISLTKFILEGTDKFSLTPKEDNLTGGLLFILLLVNIRYIPYILSAWLFDSNWIATTLISIFIFSIFFVPWCIIYIENNFNQSK